MQGRVPMDSGEMGLDGFSVCRYFGLPVHGMNTKRITRITTCMSAANCSALRTPLTAHMNDSKGLP